MRHFVEIALTISLGALVSASQAAGSSETVASLEAAVARGDPNAQTELALLYENAEGVPRDFQKANLLYCKAARQGHAEAQYRLAWAYANGRGVPRDDGIAAALLTLAAAQGDQYAAKLLQYVRPRPDSGLPPCMAPDPPPAIAAYDDTPTIDSDSDPGETGDFERKQRSEIENLVQSEIENLVHRIAPQYAVDPQLALAIISVESAFNPAAVSPKNASGLMQLIPETASRFGVKKIFNPTDNIRGGLAYVRWLLAYFKGDVPLVAAAYNAGERAVERYRGIPPYPETIAYVARITRLYKKASHPYDPAVVDPSIVMSRIRRAKN